MSTLELKAGDTFPEIIVEKVGGGSLDLGKPATGYDWKMVVVYRGKHCPLCTRYLNTLNTLLPEFNKISIDVVAVSADSQERALVQLSEVKPNYDVGFGLSIEQMQQLGLHISDPKMGMDVDAPFAEPGFFVINEQGKVQVIDTSNVPFARPDLNSMVMGLNFIKSRSGDFPISGTYQA